MTVYHGRVNSPVIAQMTVYQIVGKQSRFVGEAPGFKTVPHYSPNVNGKQSLERSRPFTRKRPKRPFTTVG